MDCLTRNDYDRDTCLEYFQAYRDCKNIWVRSAPSSTHGKLENLLGSRSDRERRTDKQEGLPHDQNLTRWSRLSAQPLQYTLTPVSWSLYKLDILN